MAALCLLPTLEFSGKPSSPTRLQLCLGSTCRIKLRSRWGKEAGVKCLSALYFFPRVKHFHLKTIKASKRAEGGL